MIKKLYILLSRHIIIKSILIFIYRLRGKIPWKLGYNEYKWKNIENVLKKEPTLDYFRKKKLPMGFGVGIDERIVEYPWIFANLNNNNNNILDAGSVFNFLEILQLDSLKNKKITIFTYYPEIINFNNRRVSYVYGDLRLLPFKNENFEEIVCQSTIEHVGMDNSMYGYKTGNLNKKKNYEYLKVIEELYRVLKRGGTLLLTFPFGKFINYNFFQQFDSEMLDRIEEFLNCKGDLRISFVKYVKGGWNFCEKEECKNTISYNPHTGEGKGNDGAAHCRSVCFVKFFKK